jgi:non-ribosomal peptide synthetase component F
MASPDAIALTDGARTMTYRELNTAANAIARHLMACGLRRTDTAVVCMPRSAELAVVLLAILKIGAAYCWIDPSSDGDTPFSAAIARYTTAGEWQPVTPDVERVVAAPSQHSSPNLPVLVRGTDTACVLPDETGRPSVPVLHATITALAAANGMSVARWDDADPAALVLWTALMTGATVTTSAPAPLVSEPDLPAVVTLESAAA